jgi:hypothetical protein
MEPQHKGLNYIEDDSIIGNADKMMFYTKEMAASAEDDKASHSPYMLTKLNLKSIEYFSFDAFQKLLESSTFGGVNAAMQDDMQKRRNFTTQHAYRFFPKLKSRAQKVFIPSMLYLTCNSIEILRLRQTLVTALIQTEILEEVYQK